MPNIGTNHLGAMTRKVVRDLAAHVWAITRGPAPSIWIGRGYDTNKATEHGTGRALDIIASSRVGSLPTAAEKSAAERVVAWLIRHADALHVRHIIWDARIWKRRYRGTPTAWTPLTKRSGISDWHQDHIHVLLDDTSGSVPSTPLDTTPIPEGDDEMTPDQIRTIIREELHRSNHEPYPSPLRLDGEDAPDMTRTTLLQQSYRLLVGIYGMLQRVLARLDSQSRG